jgi:hypothetical protein
MGIGSRQNNQILFSHTSMIQTLTFGRHPLKIASIQVEIYQSTLEGMICLYFFFIINSLSGENVLHIVGILCMKGIDTGVIVLTIQRIGN